MPKSGEMIGESDRTGNGLSLTRGWIPRLDPHDESVTTLLKSHPQLATALAASRAAAAAHFGDRLTALIRDPAFDIGIVVYATVPGQLTGVLVQPDLTPAAHVYVSMSAPIPSGVGKGTCLTGVDGSFTIAVPERARTAAKLATLTLAVAGATKHAAVQVNVADITPAGSVGTLQLPTQVDALPLSVVAQLGEIVAELAPATGAGAGQPAGSAAHSVTLGADACQQVFRSDLSTDRFPYGVLVRLIEPRPSVASLAVEVANGDRKVNISAEFLTTLNQAKYPYRFAERLPVEQPISVDGFRKGVAGITSDGKGSAASSVPVAGTLGLGYIVRLAQRWTPTGLALGDLVYSLPLAPGEQQRVAVVDRRATASVAESERLDVQEQQTFEELDNSSTRATFDSAMREFAKGHSDFSTEAHSSSWAAAGGIGFALGPIAIGGGGAGGGGDSSSSGQSNNWASGVHTYTSTAAQASHSSVERAATARRSAQRMSMRLASVSEETAVVTKTVTNHNKTHALTMQYWQVLRTFDVRSAVEGVTLVCFVPLDPIRFLPPGEPVTLPNANLDRSAVLKRYAQLLTYLDTLSRAVGPRYRNGLAALEAFAADPREQVQSSTDPASNVVTIEVKGTFLPCEDVWVTIVAKGGRRLGPYQMSGDTSPAIPTMQDDPDHAAVSEAELLGSLSTRRESGTSVTLSRSVMLPEWLPPGEVTGFELRRQFRPLRYRFPAAATAEAISIARMHGGDLSGIASLLEHLPFAAPSRDVTFTADRLEQEVGGPRLAYIGAAIAEPSKDLSTQALPPEKVYLNEYLGGIVLSTTPEPFAADQLPPQLRYSALLEIERVLQHVLSATVTYSKAIWMSLTREERVMMLEGFTIGVADGVADQSQTIPLLACVANEPLGFYGNSMVLPFMIPAELVAHREAVDGVEFTTATVQDALTRYHIAGFSPPASTIALPTDGVLGEAVLGHCASAEKIDLTRFWNWQDAPADTAPGIADVSVPTASLTAGLQAPNTLTGLNPVITNFSNAAPAADTSLLKELVSAGAAAKGMDLSSITGASALADLVKSTLSTAEAARKDALAGAQSMAQKAMDSIPTVIEAKKDTKKDTTTPSEPSDAPTVTKLEPTHGAAGADLTITGTGFVKDATTVKVGKTALDGFVFKDATQVKGKVPKAPAGTGKVDVIVTVNKKDSAPSDNSKFTYDA